MPDHAFTSVDTPHMRSAGKGMLSLALMDARNRTLRWANLLEELLGPDMMPVPFRPDVLRPQWLIGYVGWFQEVWIARNLQRDRGERCDATRPPLASIEPEADAFYDPSRSAPERRWRLPLPDMQAIRQYLSETFDVTLDLLDAAHENDDALYFYRMALFHEDAQAETLAVLAESLNLPTHREEGLLQPFKAESPRPALAFPRRRWLMGAEPGGFVFDLEKWSHEVEVPDFEIDAQPVSWQQYTEFVEDGGYDEERWWSEGGLRWLQATGRRSPRHVEQMRESVLVHRAGRLLRVPMAQPVMHVSWYEAEAWCRWAGRRLPTEVEWDLAARAGEGRGFRWGEVREWVSGSLYPYPGFVASPGSAAPQSFGKHKVLRGASVATRGRLRLAGVRRYAAPEFDEGFIGFRSCAM